MHIHLHKSTLILIITKGEGFLLATIRTTQEGSITCVIVCLAGSRVNLYVMVGVMD